MAPTSGQDASFFQFCDALEVKDGVSAPATGWGLDHALEAWGSYWTSTYLKSSKCVSDVIPTFAVLTASLVQQFAEMTTSSKCLQCITHPAHVWLTVNAIPPQQKEIA